MTSPPKDRPRGRLLVVAGPSGVGKGTVVGALRRRRPGLVVSRSVTTRRPRPGERDGVDYEFVTDEAFAAMVGDGALLEWATYAGRCYGTPAGAVEATRADGRDIVLEIDVQGALQVRSRVPDARLVLLAPPSLEVLAQRLADRGTEDPRAVADRLAVARDELGQADVFDAVVVNVVVDDAVAAVERVLDADAAV